MTVFLLHHADAVGPDVDPQRPLSTRGLAQAEWVASEAKRLGARPEVIWHSGKLRAKQTAMALLTGCNPMADFRMVRGLRPEDAPDEILHALDAEGRDVAIVSHMPLLPDLTFRLSPTTAAFPLNGMIALARDEGGSWRELWRIRPL